ncbi:hypothetical protein [Metabacillus fastidiosus]|uniref:hypothetical protein n=1 Tax=Metabacillus fastidiosus TaxID=1458 RepID=UPI003D2E5153
MNYHLIVNKVTDMIYEREPSLLERFGDKGKEKCREDNHHHMKQLESACELNQSVFFTDYAVWFNGILTKHGMKTEHLIDNFKIIQKVLLEAEDMDKEKTETYRLYLSEAIAVLEGGQVKGAV